MSLSTKPPSLSEGSSEPRPSGSARHHLTTVSLFPELVKKTGTYSIATISGRLLSLILLPVYTRFLSPTDYGVLELLDLTVNLAGLVLGARMGQAIFYFYFAAESKAEKEKCISTAFVCSVLLGASAVALSFVCAPLLSRLVFGTAQYVRYLQLVFLGFGLSLPLEAGYCAMRAFGDSRRFVVISLLTQLATAAISLILLVLFHWGVLAMLAAAVCGFAAASIYVAWYLLSPVPLSVDLRLMARLLRYSVPLGVSGIAVFFVHYGDRFFLRPQVTLAELGVYSLAYKIGMLVSFCHAPFVLHWNSQICKIGNGPDGEKIFARSFTYVCAGLSMVVVALSLGASPALKLLTTPAFRGAARVIPWIALAYLLRSAGAHIQSIFTLEGRPGLEARVNAVGAAACVVAYAVLVPRFKIAGAIVATFLGFLVILIYAFAIARRLRPLPFELRTLAHIAASTSISLAVFFLIAPSGFWQQVTLAFVVTLAHCAGLFIACALRRRGENTIPKLRGLYPLRALRF